MLILYTRPREIAARHVRFGDYIAHRRGRPGMRPALLDPSPESRGWGLKPDDEWAKVVMTCTGGRDGTALAYGDGAAGAYRVTLHPDQTVIVCERYELEPWDIDAQMRILGRPGARLSLGNLS